MGRSSRKGASAGNAKQSGAALIANGNVLLEMTGQDDSADAPTLSPNDHDPHFLSRQPLSIMQTASMITRDMKLLTPEQNDAFLSIPAGFRQIVLTCPIPAGNLDHDLGLFNLSCLSGGEMTFGEFGIYDESGKLIKGSISKESSVELSRDDIIRRVTYLAALNAANMGLLPVKKTEEPARDEATRTLKRCAALFRQPTSRWDTLDAAKCNPETNPDEFEEGPWPFFLEVITDGHDASSAMSYMLTVIIRARDPMSRLLNAQLILDSYMARRYEEDQTAVYGPMMGHRASEVKEDDAEAIAAVMRARQEAADARQNQARMQEEMGVEDARRAMDHGVRDPPKEYQRTKTGRVGKQFAAHYGLCLDEVPSYRQRIKMYLATWEHSLMHLCREFWHNSGISYDDAQKVFAFNASGSDLHRIVDSASLTERLDRALGRCGGNDMDSDSSDEDGDDDIAVCDESSRGSSRALALNELSDEAYLELARRRLSARRVNQEEMNMSLSISGVHVDTARDFKFLGPHNRSTRHLDCLFPWHVFSPLDRFCWSPGGIVSVDQMDLRNYFHSTESTPLPLGPNSGLKSMDRVLQSWMDNHGFKPSEWSTTSLNKSNVTAYMYCAEMSANPTKPVEIGSLFKGFPHPDRVYWLSPIFTTPHSVPLIPLPPARGSMQAYDWKSRAGARGGLSGLGMDWSTIEKEVAYGEGSEELRRKMLETIKDTTVHSDKPNLFHLLRHALSLIWPATPEEDAIAKTMAVFLILSEPPRGFGRIFNKIDKFFKDYSNDAEPGDGFQAHAEGFTLDVISRAIFCRLLFRQLVTETVPMYRFWSCSQNGVGLFGNHGKCTLDSNESRTFSDMLPKSSRGTDTNFLSSGDSLKSGFTVSSSQLPIIPGLFDAESTEVDSDHVDPDNWERFVDMTDEQNDYLFKHLQFGRGEQVFRFMTLPFALLKTTRRGMTGARISASRHVTSVKDKQMRQAMIYDHVARPLPEDAHEKAKNDRYLATIADISKNNRTYVPVGRARDVQALDPDDGDQVDYAYFGDPTVIAESATGGGGGAMEKSSGEPSAQSDEAHRSYYDYTVPLNVRLTSHNGFVQLGVLRSSATELQEKLREETSWSEFAGNYNIKRSTYIKNMTRPVSLFAVRVQQIVDAFREQSRRSSSNDRLWINDAVLLMRSACISVQYMQAMDQLLASQSLLPLFCGLPVGKTRARNIYGMANNGSVLMPEAFAEAFTAWRIDIGQCCNTQTIPFKAFMRNWESLQTPHAVMIAMLTQDMSTLGIGANGTADKLNYASLVYESVMSALVLSRDKLNLHSLNVIQAGQHGSSKSYSTYLLHTLFLPSGVRPVSSTSKLSMNITGVNMDGYAVYMDEGDASQSEDVAKESDMKSAWSNGFLIRKVATQDHQERTIVSSHRAAVVWNVNFSQDLISAPLASRAVLLLSPAIETDRNQSYASSFANYAGHSASESSTSKKLLTNKVAGKWHMVHAVKYIIETLVYSSCMDVDIRTATELSTVLMARFKDKVDSGSATPRITSLLSLLMRSCVTTYASFMVCMEWYVHYTHQHRDRQHSAIPIGFIMHAAPKWLFATKGIAVYAITLLFDQLVNNKQHLDAVRGILRAAGLYDVLTKPGTSMFDPSLKVPFLLRPISSTQMDSINTPSLSSGGNSTADDTGLRYSNDPQVFRNPAPSSDALDPDSRFAVDMNYVVVAAQEITSEDGLIERIYKNMLVDYGFPHLRTLLKQLKKRTFEANKHDVNRLNCKSYLELLQKDRQVSEQSRGSSLYPDAIPDENAQSEFIAQGVAAMQKMVEHRLGRATRSRSGTVQIDTASNDSNPAVETRRGRSTGSRAVVVRAGDMPRPLVTGLSRVLLTDAAKHELPLMYYARDVELPIIDLIEVVDPGAKPHSRSRSASSKNNGRVVLAISVCYIEEAVALMRTLEQADRLQPAPSEMGNIIEAALASVDTALPYPPTVAMQWYDKYEMRIQRAPLNASDERPRLITPAKEIVPTGVCSSITKVQLSQITRAAVRGLLSKYQELRACSRLVQFLDELPALIRSSGVSFGVRDIVTSRFEMEGSYALRFSANLADAYQGQATRIQMMLQRSMKTTLEHVADRHAGPMRQITCIVESMRSQMSLGQDIRLCSYSPDWEAFARSCVLKSPPIDPLNFINQRALPLLSKNYFAVIAGIKYKRRRERTLAVPELPASVPQNEPMEIDIDLTDQQRAPPDRQRKRKATTQDAPPAKKPKKTASKGKVINIPNPNDTDAMDVDTSIIQADESNDGVSTSVHRDRVRLQAIAQFDALSANRAAEREDIQRLEQLSARTGAQSASTQQALRDADLSCKDIDLPYPMNIYASQLRYQIWLLFYQRFLKCADVVANFRPAFWAKKSTEEWMLRLCQELMPYLTENDDDDIAAAGL